MIYGWVFDQYADLRPLSGGGRDPRHEDRLIRMVRE